MTPRVVQVDIHGQRYPIRSDLDPQYVAELAAFVDEKMRQVSLELASADPVRLAVVAALNITDELFRTRADASGESSRVNSRAAEIERLVDSVLSEARLKVVNG
jgi:cell division protein ZapA